MEERKLPEILDIVYAISDRPLGKGAEATVYKIDACPDYTVRVSNRAPGLEELSQKLFDEPFVPQRDMFDGRNFAQPIAYWGLDPVDNSIAMVTINLYSPGYSMEIHKPGLEEPSESEAMMRTLAVSNTVANMSDSAYDKLYDDLHFLSSREFSIDTGNGLFTNMGNILLSKKDTDDFRIIDLQPFFREHPGINRNHTKGNNTPFGLLHGLLPGMYRYREKHASYLPLVDCRTEIVSKVIQGAQRNHLNDFDGYGGNKYIKERWEYLLSQLQIPEKYVNAFVRDIMSVTQEDRYVMPKSRFPLIRVSGRSMNS